MKKDSEFLTTKTVSDMLGISIQTVHRWAKTGRLKTTMTIGSKSIRLFDRKEIEKLLKEKKDYERALERR